jgi:hypothetical protein
MDERMKQLIMYYLCSANYQNEGWYHELSQDDKTFVDRLDEAFNRGIQQGIQAHCAENL